MFVVAALALLAAAPQGQTGSVSGKVTLAGLAPKLANLPVTKDMKICGTSKPEEALEIGAGGGVKNAVVWIEDGGLSGPVPGRADPKKPSLDQQQCQFVPHVLAAPVGSWIDVISSDSVLHNVRANAAESVEGKPEGGTKLFNYAMPIKGHRVPTHLEKPGFFKVGCDVHPWMRAWIAVLPTTQFAVTGADGSFQLEGVAPGKHQLKLWHERLGERTEQIEVKAGETAKADLPMNPK